MKFLQNLVLVVLLLGCNSPETQEEKSDMNIDYLVFEFHDSSVPPPYHRSYSLTFQDSEVRIVVDAYGDILTDTTLEIGAKKVLEALDFIDQYKIGSKEKNEENEGCTGGTGISVEYGLDNEKLCSGYVYFCGGDQFGDLKGDLESLKQALKSLIPDFNLYLKE